MTPREGPVLILGAFDEQKWKRSPRRCHIQNIKSLRLPVSEKKNFEGWFFVPMFRLVTPGAGLVLTKGASYEQTL